MSDQQGLSIFDQRRTSAATAVPAALAPTTTGAVL